MTQRAEVTFEIEETIVLKQGGYFINEYCPQCQEMVDMLSPEVLSLINGVSEREIFRLVEAGAIHFHEGSRIAACPNCYRHTLAERSAELELGGPNIRETVE